MSVVSHGMNPDEVEALGRDLQQKSELLNQMMSEIGKRVGSTTWNGPDADKFKNNWWPEHQRRLQQVSRDIHGFGRSALNNASEQRRVSGH